LKDYQVLKEELRLFNPRLLEKEYFIALNKIDTIADQEEIEKIVRLFPKEDQPKIFPISAVSGQGVVQLIYALWRKINEILQTSDKEIIQGQ
jgi:GTP-binding protein